MRQPEFTYSKGLDRFLKDYRQRSELDRRVMVEVFQSGHYALFGGNTGVNFSGKGIALSVSSEPDMREQLRSALAYPMPSQPQSYVQQQSGKAYTIYLSDSERSFR